MGENGEIKMPGYSHSRFYCAGEGAGIDRRRSPPGGNTPSRCLSLSQTGFIQRDIGASPETFHAVPLRLAMSY